MLINYRNCCSPGWKLVTRQWPVPSFVPGIIVITLKRIPTDEHVARTILGNRCLVYPATREPESFLPGRSHPSHYRRLFLFPLFLPLSGWENVHRPFPKRNNVQLHNIREPQKTEQPG